MPDRPRDTEKAKAWSRMKAAVRAYAHDPSGDNIGEVESACGRLRRAGAEALLALGQTAAGPRRSPPPRTGPAPKD